MDLDKFVKTKVKFADNKTVLAGRKGKILIQQKGRDHAFISIVFYVPTMKKNLFSLGQLLEKGYLIKMEQGYLVISNARERIILKALL